MRSVGFILLFFTFSATVQAASCVRLIEAMVAAMRLPKETLNTFITQFKSKEYGLIGNLSALAINDPESIKKAYVQQFPKEKGALRIKNRINKNQNEQYQVELSQQQTEQIEQWALATFGLLFIANPDEFKDKDIVYVDVGLDFNAGMNVLRDYGLVDQDTIPTAAEVAAAPLLEEFKGPRVHIDGGGTYINVTRTLIGDPSIVYESTAFHKEKFKSTEFYTALGSHAVSREGNAVTTWQLVFGPDNFGFRKEVVQQVNANVVGETIVITGADRTKATGRPATMHSGPVFKPGRINLFMAVQ